jgi:hypothetical protein
MVSDALERVACSIGQPAELLHVVWPDGRALCGLRVGPRDLFPDRADGWAFWGACPGWRCRSCETRTTRLEIP